MRKVWCVAILAVFALTIGCGAGGGAEGAAKKILEGIKKGDNSVIFDHVDLKGFYEASVPEAQREEFPFEKFEKMMREAAEKEKEVPEGFEYEILGSEVKGDVTIVKVKVKENKDAEWEEQEVPFKQIDGKWKITAEGFQKLAEQG